MPIASLARETGAVTRTSVDTDDSGSSGTCPICGAVEIELAVDGPDGPIRECINGHHPERPETAFSIGGLQPNPDDEFAEYDEYEDLDRP